MPSNIGLCRIWLIVLIVLLDQGTKHIAVSSLEPNRPMAILPSVEWLAETSDLEISVDRGGPEVIGVSTSRHD